MRKIRFPQLSCVIVCVLLFLSGCGRAVKKDAGPNVAPVGNPDTFSCAVFYYDYADVYISSVRAQLNKYLVLLGIPYNEFDASSSQSMQNAQIESAIAAGAKLLIVNIVNSGSSDTSDAICLKAERAGIPVIFFNRSR